MTVVELEALRADMKCPDSQGDCFLVALILALSNPQAFLCHGIITGNGGELLGKQAWHAWVELDGDQGTICIDRSAGQNASVRKADYYKTCQAEYVVRYTQAETMTHARRTDSAGPWL